MCWFVFAKADNIICYSYCEGYLYKEHEEALMHFPLQLCYVPALISWSWVYVDIENIPSAIMTKYKESIVYLLLQLSRCGLPDLKQKL